MPAKFIEIALRLSEAEWAELYYAVESKRQAVRIGYYGGARAGNERWAGQLRRITQVLERQFRKHRIVY